MTSNLKESWQFGTSSTLINKWNAQAILNLPKWIIFFLSLKLNPNSDTRQWSCSWHASKSESNCTNYGGTPYFEHAGDQKVILMVVNTFFLLASKNVIQSHSHLCCLHLKWVFPCQERMFTLTPPVVPQCSVTYAWRVSLKVTQSYGWLALYSIQAHWSQSTDVQLISTKQNIWTNHKMWSWN